MVVYWRALPDRYWGVHKLKPVWKLLVMILLGVALSGCGTRQEANPAGQRSRPYAHASGVFSLELPPTWRVADLSEGAVIRVMFSPPEAASPYLTVTVVRLEGPIDDTAFAAAMGAYLRAARVQGVDVHETTAMGDGSWRVTAVRTAQGVPQPINLFLQRDGSYFSVLEAVVPGDDAFSMALLSLLLNSYAVNPEADWPPGDLELAAQRDPDLLVAGGNLVFGNIRAWEDAEGVFHLTGLVANRATYPVEEVAITARFLDGTGAVQAEAQAALPVPVLLDGEQLPFDIAVSDGWPRLAVRYELQATARAATAADRVILGAEGFEWEDEAQYDAQGGLHIQGMVWNTGGATVQAVQSVVTVFDEADRVIGVVPGPVIEQALAPGDSARFDVPLASLGGEPIRYQLTLWGVR